MKTVVSSQRGFAATLAGTSALPESFCRRHGAFVDRATVVTGRFHEYFHGDNGLGLGASHQTGWSGLVANLIKRRYELQAHGKNRTTKNLAEICGHDH